MTFVKLGLKILSILIIAIFSVSISSGSAQAQIEDWLVLQPQSRAFEARFPRDYTLKEQTLRMDDVTQTVLFISEYTAHVEENGNEKTYVIKQEQKIGNPLTSNMIAFALKMDTDRYTKLAANLKGKIVVSENVNFGDFRGKDIEIAYKENGKKMGIRVRILFTDVTRIYLVAQGTADSLYTFRSRNFFNTIKLFDKHTTIPGSFNDQWRTIPSTLNLFSLKVPPSDSEYLDGPPVFKSTEKGETVEYFIIDPILRYKTRYLIKAFILDKPITPQTIKETFVKDNIAKYVANPSEDSLNMNKIKAKDYDIFTANAKLPTSIENPHTNYIMLEAHYKDNVLVIQETAGADDHVLTPGISVMNGFLFHPEKYWDAVKQGTNPKDPAAAADELTKKFSDESKIIKDAIKSSDLEAAAEAQDAGIDAAETEEKKSDDTDKESEDGNNNQETPFKSNNSTDTAETQEPTVNSQEPEKVPTNDVSPKDNTTETTPPEGSGTTTTP